MIAAKLAEAEQQQDTHPSPPPQARPQPPQNSATTGQPPTQEAQPPQVRRQGGKDYLPRWKRIGGVGGNMVATIAGADGAAQRYRVGSVLPGGYVIEVISPNGVLVHDREGRQITLPNVGEN